VGGAINSIKEKKQEKDKMAFVTGKRKKGKKSRARRRMGLFGRGSTLRIGGEERGKKKSNE